MVLVIVFMSMIILNDPVEAASGTRWTYEAYTLSPHAKWTTGGTAGYYEGDMVPHRLIAKNYQLNLYDPIIIAHDYFDTKGAFGFDGVDGHWFIGPIDGLDINNDPITVNTPINLIPEWYSEVNGDFSVSGPVVVSGSSYSSEPQVLEYTLEAYDSNGNINMDMLTALAVGGTYDGTWAMYWQAHLSQTATYAYSPALSDYIAMGSGFRTGNSLHSYCNAEYSGFKTLPIGAPFANHKSIPVCKEWDPETPVGISATVLLLADDYPYGDPVLYDGTGLPISLNSTDGWCSEWVDVPIWAASGNENYPIEYSIEEVPIPGYTTVITGNAVDGFLVTNTLDRGCIEVTKSFNLGNVIDPDGLIDQNFTIEITGPSYPTGDSKSGTGNQMVQWCDLIPGTYSVSENDVDRGLFNVVGEGDVTVPAGGTGYATITNTYIPGCIEVTKSFNLGNVIDPDGLIDQNFTIEITGPSYPTGDSKSGTGNQMVQWCDLIPGTYSVSENDVDRGLFNVVGEGDVTVPAGGTGYATITNTLIYHDETAWALEYPDTANRNWDLTNSNNWGWYIGPYDTTSSSSLYYDLWAGAGSNDTSAPTATLVGNIQIVIDAVNEKVTVHYNVDPEFELRDTHLWIGETPLPKKGNKFTDAPGQFKFEPGVAYDYSKLNELYIAAHAVVRIFGD